MSETVTAIGSANTMSSETQKQCERDAGLVALLGFLKTSVESNPRAALDVSLHHAPLAEFGEEGTFESVVLRDDHGRRYLVGRRKFGPFTLTAFSETIEEKT